MIHQSSPFFLRTHLFCPPTHLPASRKERINNNFSFFPPATEKNDLRLVVKGIIVLRMIPLSALQRFLCPPRRRRRISSRWRASRIEIDCLCFVILRKSDQLLDTFHLSLLQVWSDLFPFASQAFEVVARSLILHILIYVTPEPWFMGLDNALTGKSRKRLFHP